MEYNNKYRKALFEKIRDMNKTEHEEIFKIIRANNQDMTYSKNKNGIFFNLSSMNDETINNVSNFVDYCLNNKKALDEYDQKINECKINNNLTFVSLDNIPKQNAKSEDWNAIAGGDTKAMQKISLFIENIMNSHERISKKKANQKFSNAKKKYSKKTCVERKFETEDIIELLPDEYLI